MVLPRPVLTQSGLGAGLSLSCNALAQLRAIGFESSDETKLDSV